MSWKQTTPNRIGKSISRPVILGKKFKTTERQFLQSLNSFPLLFSSTFLLHFQQHHAVCGPAVAAWHQRGPLDPAAEWRAAQQEASALPCLWEGMDWVFPWHRANQSQEGVPGGVWGLLRVHAQAEIGKCRRGAQEHNGSMCHSKKIVILHL